MQGLTQRSSRDSAQVVLAAVNDVGHIAVGVFQQAQCSAAAPVALLRHHGKSLACNVARFEHGGGIHTAHKFTHVVGGGLAQNFVGCAHLHHFAVFHDG